MPEPLFATQAQLEIHFDKVAEILAAAIDISADTQVAVNWDVDPVVVGLVGDGCESIQRNRGARVHVAPLMQLEQGLWIWLSYREEWASERPVGGKRRFSFRASSVTIHFGWKQDLFKPQMFRAEWAGWARWNDREYSFQAANAGHPHWQFDALDSLPDEEASRRAAMLRDILEGDGGESVRDFSPQLPQDDIRDLVTNQKFSRMHFASAAAWWKSAPQNDHAHCPARLLDVQSWLRHSLSYLRTELGRLQVA